MGLLYIIIGLKHFINTDFFITIVPTFIIYKKEVVLLSGSIEVILGTSLLFNKTRKFASWGIILLLISVFPANIYLYISETPREILEISKSQAFLRMPFQIALITIAYWHSKEVHTKRFAIICSLLFITTIIYFTTL